MDDSFEKAFGWFAIINRIANDDLTKHDKILQTTVLEALNQLLYIMEKEKQLIRIQKKAMGQI